MPIRYWWVSQNKTHAQEISGGYLWSPKRKRPSKKTGTPGRNQYYDNMRAVSPGDIIFSFYKKKIGAIGVATTYGQDCPKPDEFGQIGSHWETAGWRVGVQYRSLTNAIEPARHMDLIRSLLPSKYSPLHPSGRGLEIYLAEISREFGEVLIGLIGSEAKSLIPVALATGDKFHQSYQNETFPKSEWEDVVAKGIETNSTIPETEKVDLIKSRRGQGTFRKRLMAIESSCRVTKVDTPSHLIASHIKPWRHANNEERLNGENGLLLTPNIDHLFDGGFISFAGSGKLIISPVAHRESLHRMGIHPGTDINVGSFTRAQQQYLEFHRDSILLTNKTVPE